MSNETSESSANGHDFHKKMLRPGHCCHHCGESLWGSAAACRACKFVAHERCADGSLTPCSRVAIHQIARPVAHTWSAYQKFKKKYCNVCRKKMDDRTGVRCIICKYYAHKSCMGTSLPACKLSAEYNAFVTPDEHSQTRHQWLEGNLKPSDKCVVCTQVCGTSDCLSGQRCLWCLTTIHSSCKKEVDRRCSMGLLKNLILPAYAVYRPAMPETDSTVTPTTPEFGAVAPSLSISENMLGFRLREGTDGDDVSIAESLHNEATLQSSALVTLKVYDSSLNVYKRISVPSDADADEILAAALLEFRVQQDETNTYCLAVEVKPEEYEPVDKLAGAIELEKLVLRSTDQYTSQIRIHYSSNHQSLEYHTLSASPLTTSDEIVTQALSKFGMCVTEKQRRAYVLVEMNMYNGVNERILEGHEKPWKIMHDFAKISVQQAQMVRLYLRNIHMDLPATFYVGNLPVTWNEERLERTLKEALGTTISESTTFGPAFPKLGCIFLHVHNEDAARQACTLIKTSITVEAKRPKLLVVPTIQEEVMPDNCSPLITFVNERSGGGQGSELMGQLIRLLNPYQVFNLSHGGPVLGLFAFRKVKQFRVLVAGGDGTVGWVLSQIDAMRQLFRNPGASVAVIPLGTGNDLARVLRWGAGFSGESAMSILEVIDDSLIVPLDRWNVVFENDVAATNNAVAPLMGTTDVADDESREEAPAMEPTQLFVMNNYFGIGVEAEIALKFHLAREENPEKFSSRLHNKGVYLKVSIGKMMTRSSGSSLSKDLSKGMSLEVDGQSVKIPSGTEGIIVLNIKSWMAGCDGWGSDRDDKFKAPSMNDGLVEVIGVQGVMHLGQIQGGLRSGIRLAQGSDISMRILKPTPVEIDGEPSLQPVGRCRIVQGNTVQMMRRHKRLYSNLGGPNSSAPPPSGS